MRILSRIAVLGLIILLNSKSSAETVNFDAGVTFPRPFTYVENGLQFTLYGDAVFSDFAGGKALTIQTAADVIITRVGGGAFSLNSLLTLGPNYAGIYGWVNAADFVSGGNNDKGTGPGSAGPVADVSIDMSTINPNTIFPLIYDARWGHIEIIDFCGYCVTSQNAGGGMDNLNFSIAADVAETPIPAALPLFAGGLGVIALLARRRKQKAKAAT